MKILLDGQSAFRQVLTESVSLELRGKIMATVSVKDKYVEVLTTFGDLQTAIDQALQRYTIEQIAVKIAELQQKDTKYQTKYGMEYPTFVERMAKDETLINQVEAEGNKMWEIDLADWEFCYKGIEDWTQKLPTILLA